MLTNEMILKAARYNAIIRMREILSNHEPLKIDRTHQTHAFNNWLIPLYLEGEGDHFDGVARDIRYLTVNRDWLHNVVQAIMYLRHGERTIRPLNVEFVQ